MQYSDWLTQYLERVANSCEEGYATVKYLRARGTKIGIKRARKSVGGFWTPTGSIFLNSIHHSYEGSLDNPRAWTLLIHEARHLQQGLLTALSVYGELDAWQHEFRIYKKLTNSEFSPALEELLRLPLNWDRTNLAQARHLMQTHAGKGYRIDLLPLYPLPKEIRYWLTRRVPFFPTS
ncbi:MAG: hypothetical protein AB1649_32565 [Chloroflexota bacterium]